MSIQKTEIDGEFELICDYCIGFIGYVHQNYIDSGATKAEAVCLPCNKHYIENNGLLVKGVGIVTKDLLDKINKIDIEEAVKPTKAPRKPKGDASKIQWENIDKLINEEKCKVKPLADEFNINAQELKELMVAHYGNRIEFRRGRNGGVYWKAGE